MGGEWAESGRIKVGVTSNLEGRLAGYRTHWPERMKVLGTVRCATREAAYSMEAMFLVAYRGDWSHGEWLNRSDGVLDGIRSVVGKFQDWDRFELSGDEIGEIKSRMAAGAVRSCIDDLGVGGAYARWVFNKFLRCAITGAIIYLGDADGRTRMFPDAEILSDGDGAIVTVRYG